eukprot:scaffold37720_cov67-Phaeocystis_antarctica.AAC.25
MGVKGSEIIGRAGTTAWGGYQYPARSESEGAKPLVSFPRGMPFKPAAYRLERSPRGPAVGSLPRVVESCSTRSSSSRGEMDKISH